MDAMDIMIAKWESCNLDKVPYLLNGDEYIIKNPNVYVNYKTLEEYILSDDFGLPNSKFHLGLIPIPYMGNLKGSSIFILTLNPGLSNIDYYGEQCNNEYRDALKNNLHQENLDSEYPFVCLNTKFSWHAGFEYWWGKLRLIIEEVSRMREISLSSALSNVSKVISILELVPYHSITNRVINNLTSTKLVKQFVKELLVKKADNDKASIVVARGARQWELIEHENIVIYNGPQARGASLSPNSKGGALIMERLNKLL